MIRREIRLLSSFAAATTFHIKESPNNALARYLVPAAGARRHEGGVRRKTMMKQLALFIAAFASVSAIADIGDDTLRQYMSKSDVVLAAQLKSLTVERGTNSTTYKLVFMTHTGGVYHGRGPHGEEITVDLLHPGDLPPGELTFPFSEGTAYILFLKKPLTPESKAWRPADPWFAVQPHYSALAHALRRLSLDERRKKE
jgi:hypothetical protein